MTDSSSTNEGSKRRDFLRGVAASALVGVARPAPSRAETQIQKARSLFDGKTLMGWRTVPRASPEQWERYKRLKASKAGPSPKDEVFLARMAQSGRWTVEDGAIVGGQEPPGSGLGAYLVSSEKFADFELELEANPDWPTDTGVMIRCQEIATVGLQVLVDHRPNGCIGGYYGNGIGGFRAYPYVIDADTTGPADAPRRPTRMRAGTQPDGVVSHPQYGAPVEDFLRAWRPGDWNRFRIRCVGALPIVTTWINDIRISEFDAARFEAPGYDPKDFAAKLGREGHIALEVHDNDPRLGKERWWPGAVCRWRNIRITTLQG